VPIEGGRQTYEYQTPATLNAVLVQNEWQWIMGTGNVAGAAATYESGVRIYDIGVGVETADETLELKIVSDGQTLMSDTFAATAATSYEIGKLVDAVTRTGNLVFSAAETYLTRAFLHEGKQVAVAYRKTTALGANAGTVVVTWGQLTNA